MRFVRRYYRRDDDGGPRYGRLFVTLLLGASHALAAAIVAEALTETQGGNEILLMAFVATAALNLIILRLVTEDLHEMTEAFVHAIRVGISDHLDRMRWLHLARFGKDTVVFNAFGTVRLFAQSGTLNGRLILNSAVLLCVMVPVVIISPPLALIYFAMLLSLIAGWLYQDSTVYRHMQSAQHLEKEVSKSLSTLLNGFQELKLNAAKSEEFFSQEIQRNIDECSDARRKANLESLATYGVFQIIQFIAVGTCIFGVATFLPEMEEASAKLALIIAFLPISILRDLPLVSRGDRAAESIERFEQDFGRAAADPVALPDPAFGETDFKSLDLEGVTFAYQSETEDREFSLGPISFRFQAGEVYFLTGGNGSGKSTLLTLIAGLQRPDSGQIRLNDAPVEMEAWGDLFTPVFYDFHLFERLYGLRETPAEEVNAMLTRLRIAGKTGYDEVDSRFTTQALSTGQMRRLAMAVALLEDRPIYLLDEWAADQDPQFRDELYTEILPNLRLRGKTVILATHDDRYFDSADVVITMRDGGIDRVDKHRQGVP